MPDCCDLGNYSKPEVPNSPLLEDELTIASIPRAYYQIHRSAVPDSGTPPVAVGVKT